MNLNTEVLATIQACNAADGQMIQYLRLMATGLEEELMPLSEAIASMRALADDLAKNLEANIERVKKLIEEED